MAVPGVSEILDRIEEPPLPYFQTPAPKLFRLGYEALNPKPLQPGRESFGPGFGSTAVAVLEVY